jgi:hypothetical protein
MAGKDIPPPEHKVVFAGSTVGPVDLHDAESVDVGSYEDEGDGAVSDGVDSGPELERLR